ncbi:hypothetical protein [Rhizobium laguerreae]|uniref:hypothetical protein n=1 Tax=Rhizobium laguerreae TaxID=1076926 RepID=UPI001C900CE3|nr:hypothetical protein [Rhizobium laguerreae]MBY3441806.1 hypothetical protein [Rhizobium laguerreae]
MAQSSYNDLLIAIYISKQNPMGALPVVIQRLNYQGRAVSNIEGYKDALFRVMDSGHARYLPEKIRFPKVGNQTLVTARPLRAE